MTDWKNTSYIVTILNEKKISEELKRKMIQQNTEERTGISNSLRWKSKGSKSIQLLTRRK